MTDYERSEIAEEIAHVLTCSVTGGAWAVMDEWGTGSLMDESNPFLNRYIGSELWNPDRQGLAISSREKGPYTDIFGNQQTSDAPSPGYNLELLQDRKNPPKILLIPPSHAMQRAIGWLRAGGFQIIIGRVLREMDWRAFIEVEVK